ncbi:MULTISPECIES: hypothetical protein [Rheinheimera]|uniref:TAT leader-containing periplasmic protein n=1 Tax=Rheinheimera marina TaxID=1774958 RepID=A0ABV9JFZ3_9GAMM
MHRRQFLFSTLALLVSASTGWTVYQYQQADGSADSATLVVEALLPALLAGALPHDPQLAAQQLRQTRQAVLQYLGFLAKSQQAQLHQLFAVLETDLLRLALTGHWLSLTELPLVERLRLLDSWRDSYLQLMQQAYAACKELLLGAYYGDPAHWQPLQYQPPVFNPVAAL